ncbi:MAG: glutamine--fructose-6-phosphate transaminase (isomerizing) [Planctomycetes bacterium]|nr:glutamine--fructose-6-phosphate transaminase (isomerizing) [Planctomycetota bacterium]
MCGIVGAFLRGKPCLAALVRGLRVLEYRGYDSVGVGVLQAGELVVRRKAGRIEELERLLAADAGALDEVSVGIGHSRWATHGPPTDENAHPHCDWRGRIALVHNGIIENYQELRAELALRKIPLRSQTDTEVLAHWIGIELEGAGGDLAEAVRRALLRVRGYYAIAVLSGGERPQMVASREGPPLCLASTPEGAWLASDPLALIEHARDIVFLEDGDVAELAPGKLVVRGRDGALVARESVHVAWNAEAADRGGFAHFMLKEIHEQPDVVARGLFGRVDLERGDVTLPGEFFSDASLKQVTRVQISACGTALHAGLVARYLIEGLAGVPVDVDFASEFRYRQPVLVPGTLALGISQSGETADTLAALRLARSLGCRQLSFCNAVGSTMVRESEATLLLEAGPEIGVASTKAFVAMLVAATLFAVRLGRARARLTRAAASELLGELGRMRMNLERLLTREVVDKIRALAERHKDARGFLFLARGINYPIALEGALKLKEISYKHAEGYAAGEMKHGPIAMIDRDMTTVVIASRDSVASKVRSNIEQIRARGGPVICVGDDEESLAVSDERVVVPGLSPWLSPIANVVPLQLFAYHVALARGCDIDKPRNLAKSVTVE